MAGLPGKLARVVPTALVGGVSVPLLLQALPAEFGIPVNGVLAFLAATLAALVAVLSRDGLLGTNGKLALTSRGRPRPFHVAAIVALDLAFVALTLYVTAQRGWPLGYQLALVVCELVTATLLVFAALRRREGLAHVFACHLAVLGGLGAVVIGATSLSGLPEGFAILAVGVAGLCAGTAGLFRPAHLSLGVAAQAGIVVVAAVCGLFRFWSVILWMWPWLLAMALVGVGGALVSLAGLPGRTVRERRRLSGWGWILTGTGAIWLTVAALLQDGFVNAPAVLGLVLTAGGMGLGAVVAGLAAVRGLTRLRGIAFVVVGLAMMGSGLVLLGAGALLTGLATLAAGVVGTLWGASTGGVGGQRVQSWFTGLPVLQMSWWMGRQRDEATEQLGYQPRLVKR